ncbi:MAG: DNA polymerase III subunit alpha [Clostridiaceae bacterium]|nr:DNA polymerase III subunit alpha [Clostridiaceae bacterium]
MAFTHLHLHTEYSLLDGANRIHELPGHLKELGMDACAITDHGSMYGVLDFYRTMKEEGIHPVIGCEVYVAQRSHRNKDAALDREPYHLILLAENNEGYENLVKLVSAGHVDGFYYRPRIDKTLLAQHAQGLIALSACLSGEVPRLILAGERQQAAEAALEHRRLFGENNYFLEIQGNGLEDQALVNAELIRISRETGIPLVATNDCHYLLRDDAFAHEVLLCMQTGKNINSPDRMKMGTDTLYVRSPREMEELFANVPEALANTEQIAARCQVEIKTGEISLPHFETEPGETAEQMLSRLCAEGLEKRLLQRETGIARQAYLERLDYELSVINSMGYTDYYLIVWDFIRFAHERGIMVGPGRGSGAASLAAYTLFITDIDPLKYDLLFERFLNKERVSMPDFDIDFCYERRGEVIDYVTEKYGADHVCQVITFGTLAARAVIRDVGRALDVSYAEIDRIAKMIPNQLKITIDLALQMNPDLRKLYEDDDTTRRIIDLAKRFEGMPRHASTHAAGVIIAGKPVCEIAPLARNDESIVVQFTKDDIEDVGLLKFDFLGLRTLTVLQETSRLVEEKTGTAIDFDRMTYDDPRIFDMIGRGETDAVFQLEGGGMTQFLKELQPESFEDIIAGVALFRPGPMEQIPRYVKARHDPKKVRYDWPLLEPILKVTYGVIVYQEQVIRIVRDLAGFSSAQADNVRRAMGKKNESLLQSYRTLFIEGGTDENGVQVKGAVANGVPRKVAEKLFEDIYAFAGYAFNKAHAASYAAVAYNTAWCKYYYPVEYMAAILNSHLGDLDKAGQYIRAAESMGVPLLPPDINRSGPRFHPEGEAIRFGLAAVKNVGRDAIEALIRERGEAGPFASYGAFLRRMCDSALNRKMIESLIRSSALDFFGIGRSRMIAVIEPFCDSILSAKKGVMEGQITLFDLSADEALSQKEEPDYPNVPDFTPFERLTMEKDMTGLYITGHPLSSYREAMDSMPLTMSREIRSDDLDPESDAYGGSGKGRSLQDRDRVVMAGLVVARRDLFTKNNDRMSFMTMEDETGSWEVIVFPKTYTAFHDLMDDYSALLIAGSLDLREEEPKLLADWIAPLEQDMRGLPASFKESDKKKRPWTRGEGDCREEAVRRRAPKPPEAVQEEKTPANHRAVVIRIPAGAGEGYLDSLRAALGYFSGNTPVRLFHESKGSFRSAHEVPSIAWDDETAPLLMERFGSDNFGIL